MARFGDIVYRANTREDRFNTKKKYYVGGEHILSSELLVRDKGIIEGSTIGPMFYCGFNDGDVLFVTRNPHLKKSAQVTFNGICSEKTLVLRSIDENILLQSYLPIIMQTDEFWNYCEDNKSGGVNYFINWSTLAEYEFDLPSVEVQKSICEKVWAAYRLKEAYQRLLNATDEMVKSQFLEMFGNPMADSESATKLKDNVTLVLGSTPKSKTEKYWNGSLPWITPAELTDDSFEVSNTERCITMEGVASANLTEMPAGTVLFSTRAPIGKTAITTVPMYCNQGFKNMICGESINNVFLYYTLRLNKEYLQSLGTGTTFKELSKAVIEKLSIKVPPIESQTQFATIYRQADKSKFELRKAISAIDEVIKSLING